MNAGITNTDIWGISGTSGSDVYAAGKDTGGNGVIWHYNGTKWSKDTAPQGDGMIDVAIGGVAAGARAPESRRGYAVGEGGRLLRGHLFLRKVVMISFILSLLLLNIDPFGEGAPSENGLEIPLHDNEAGRLKAVPAQGKR